MFKVKSISKNGYFIFADNYSRQIGFNVKGLFRSYYIDGNGRDYTNYFIEENNILLAYEGYLSKEPSKEFIEAVEDCEILIADLIDFEKLLNEDELIRDFFSIILNKYSIMKEKRKSSFELLDNSERYEKFLEQYPGLEERINLSQLASFLGMSSVNLSRIRKTFRLTT